jgi:predicted HicB family RNase H-like nuclease
MYVTALYKPDMTLDAIMMMRFPTEVKAALSKAAKAEQRSMSNLTLSVMTDWLVENGYMKPAKPAAKRGR